GRGPETIRPAIGGVWGLGETHSSTLWKELSMQPLDSIRPVRFAQQGRRGVAIGLALGASLLLAAPASAGAQAAPSTTPKAYIGLFKDNDVAVLDTSSNKVMQTIAIPAGPHGLVVTPDGRCVYASSDGASTVSVIDTRTD